MSASAGDFPVERKALADAGRRLLEKGLVARTWGNLSTRVSDTHFLITPSGRNYETLEPEHMALVALDDLSWGGDMKPSSEKDLHARMYRNRSDVKAVIHTHQPAASSLAAARKGFHPLDAAGDADRVGAEIPCVPYALPTTRPLAEASEKTLIAAGPDCRAMLLSNHGAICLGADIDTAIDIAAYLEIAAERHILNLFRGLDGNATGVHEDMLAKAATGLTSEYREIDPAFADKISGDLQVYLNRKMKGRVILVSDDRWIRAAADRGTAVRPMLDDLAQIIGMDLPVVHPSARGGFRRIRRYLTRTGLGRRSAVLLPGIGCVCDGNDAEDAAAIAMVASKGCRASIESVYLGGGHNISRIESLLMRFIYLVKYSRKAG